jgi:hypothetical protein
VLLFTTGIFKATLSDAEVMSVPAYLVMLPLDTVIIVVVVIVIIKFGFQLCSGVRLEGYITRIEDMRNAY